jgi:putative component of toxin-antitoxin plasmid stabilization module
MPIFALKKIEAIVGKQEFFYIIIDRKSQFESFCDAIKNNSQYVSELKTILTIMDLVANLQSLPKTKFKDITPPKETVKEYEFKSKNLRVYAFHIKQTGKIVAYWGFKNSQRKDIEKFRSIKRQYLQSI